MATWLSGGHLSATALGCLDDEVELQAAFSLSGSEPIFAQGAKPLHSALYVEGIRPGGELQLAGAGEGVIRVEWRLADRSIFKHLAWREWASSCGRL